ncbi:MAG: hypothetical protein PT977_06805 [Acidobacteriota bacterium]|nr:hypothetical protein [Acidobacteriota bacterium]
MKNLMRNLTLSAAALAALVSIAPKADAQDWTHARGSESRREGEFRGNERREGRGRVVESPRREFREERRGEFRGREFHGQGWGGDYGGREFRGHAWGGRGYGGRAFFRAPAFLRPPAFFGRGYSRYSVYGGSRFYSSCPGNGYVYVNDLGWVYPPYAGAVWAPAYYDEDGSYVEGCWE